MTKKMMNTRTTMAAVETAFCSNSSVDVLTGIQWKATATDKRPADMPQAVETRILRRPQGSANIALTKVMTKLVPATTRPTAVGLENPTRAKRVEE